MKNKKHWADSKLADTIWWIGDSVVFLLLVAGLTFVTLTLFHLL